MKRTIFILIGFLIICDSILGQDSYAFYYGFDERIDIHLIPNKRAYNCSMYDENAIRAILGARGIRNVTWKNDKMCIIEYMQDRENSTFVPLSDIDGVLSYPVCQIGENMDVILFNEITLYPLYSIDDIQNIIDKYGMTLQKHNEVYYKFMVPLGQNVIAIANEIYETGLVEFSYPQLFFPLEKFDYIPNDPYFIYQVALHNIGQVFNDNHCGTAGADINAPKAWEITKGSPYITIAVFDEGVTSDHPDLPNSRQVRLDGSNFGFGNPNDPSPTGNHNHGNACAGVIAATMDNNEGIAGIAPRCKIMPLRYDDTSFDTDLADGIKFAADNGANILSCSWGILNSCNQPNLSPVIKSAINYAISNNVVVVFAAGNTANHVYNDDGCVQFPANSKIKNMIVVGASDRYDKMANYSPKSTLIDVVAPSHRAYPKQIVGETLEMWSIDIPGTVGYNPAPSELSYVTSGEVLPNWGTNYLSYTGRFGGTSHACPVVAGVVALMLTVNHTLTPSDVYEIITSTSAKVGGYTYNNGKCAEMGYGRVDAYAALKKAKEAYIQNTTYTSGTTVVESHIDLFAGNRVTDEMPYGDVVVKAGSDVKYRATIGVHLMRGFKVEAGGHFIAEISSPNVYASYPLMARKQLTTNNQEEDNINANANVEDALMTISPNPVCEVLNIITTDMLENVAIYNLNGQCVIQTTQAEVNVSTLPSGIYILRTITTNGELYQDKFIKQ